MIEIFNNTEFPLTIKLEEIASLDSYEIPTEDVVDWAKSAYLRFLVQSGQCSVVVYGTSLDSSSGSDWLVKISSGNIVFE